MLEFVIFAQTSLLSAISALFMNFIFHWQTEMKILGLCTVKFLACPEDPAKMIILRTQACLSL